MKKTVLKAAMALAIGAGAVSAQAATLNAGDILTINDGVAVYDTQGYVVNVTSGSFFGMDTGGDSKIANTEKTPIDGLAGITIGSTQGIGVIDQWSFFGSPGTHYTVVAPTGGTTGGVDMSGWTVFWPNPGGAAIPMVTGAWQPAGTNCTNLGVPAADCLAGFTNGTAFFHWDGVYGNAYQLYYTATVPAGAPCCVGVKYFLKLEGTVQQGQGVVPVPAAVWLFGSGLLGLVGIARRKKKA